MPALLYFRLAGDPPATLPCIDGESPLVKSRWFGHALLLVAVLLFVLGRAFPQLFPDVVRSVQRAAHLKDDASADRASVGAAPRAGDPAAQASMK
jgi:hypothetical protein